MTRAIRAIRMRLLGSGAIAVLVLLGLSGAAGARWGSDWVVRVLVWMFRLAHALAPMVVSITLALLGLLLMTAAIVRQWRQGLRSARSAALDQGARQGRAALLEEVRVMVHGHLKPYVIEVEQQLAALRESACPEQRGLLLRELDYSVQRLRSQIVGLHGQVAAPIAEQATALPDDLERTLREVTWSFRSLVPRVTLEVAGVARPIGRRQVVALELALYNALTNVRLHARAQRAQVRLQYELDYVSLSICDDGRGFDVRRRRSMGRGLHDLERAAAGLGGRIDLMSRIGQGTELTIRLPVARPALGWAALQSGKEGEDGRAIAAAAAMGARS